MFIYYKSEDITYLVLILNATNHSALLFLLLISSAKAVEITVAFYYLTQFKNIKIKYRPYLLSPFL